MTIINSINELEASFEELYTQVIENALKNYKLGCVKPSTITPRSGDKINQLISQALFNSNLTNAIELMSQFLSAGRGKAPLLWYATVIDLVAICDELHLPNSELVKQEIANDAVHWEDFPKQFLPLTIRE